MQRQLSRVEADLREPSAKELVQRHRIASTSSAPPISPKRPSLSILKRGGSIIPTVQQQLSSASFSLSRDCVFSLHQNFRTKLIYGKNNVEVIIANGDQPLKGYLSVHQDNSAEGQLTLKWTPNMLMHSSSQPTSDTSPHSLQQTNNATINHVSTPPPNNSAEDWLWKCAINVCLDKIIYLHLHQKDENEPAQIVLIDTEGVQHSSFQFSTAQQCVTFLAALENGLAPLYRLEPPLWNHEEKGKILPRIRRRTSVCANSDFVQSNNDNKTEESTSSMQPLTVNNSIVMEYANDYVFRIISTSTGKPSTNFAKLSHNTFSGKPANFLQQQQQYSFPDIPLQKNNGELSSTTTNDDCITNQSRSSLSTACESMRQQIVSRAFYGWLAYCRHLKTIRTYLATIVNDTRIQSDDAVCSVNDEFWKLCRSEKTIALYSQLLVRVYLYGIESHLRPAVWPYLLRLVNWHEDLDEQRLSKFADNYKRDVAAWEAIEAEVVKRDAAALEEAKQRQKSCNHNDNLDNPLNSIQAQSSPNGTVHKNATFNKNSFSDDSGDSSEVCLNRNRTNETPEYNIVADFGKNLHRIDKDVERCDRNTQFFSDRKNLEPLRRLMCTFVWRHLVDGYIQGMCDIAAPLLVVFNDEVLALECFEILMGRLSKNFPHKNHGIESNLNNLRSLVQVMDPDLFYQVMNNADHVHLYFAYRWFLLDFKRELTYDEVFRVWETIWAAEKTVSGHFQLFFALALLTQYREVLIENNMDFTDVIKFFNEMAEKHNANELLQISREKLNSLQEIILDMKN